ncbi:hypothetical protein HU200_002727 [Digitaria exilis]|uniref:Cytochrome b5 heme-binding domain-containing protein n=1 Tax=Digitaria exilis TaxID=1010633 RepID=A0A835FWJ1_9POAL|nr:hypothetical protein HU200_002727 [Digitaria exilis]
MEEHPGGDEVLLACTGKDATADFERIGHSESATLPRISCRSTASARWRFSTRQTTVSARFSASFLTHHAERDLGPSSGSHPSGGLTSGSEADAGKQPGAGAGKKQRNTDRWPPGGETERELAGTRADTQA